MPVQVTMPDGEIAELARDLGRRLGISEIDAVREALRRMLSDDNASRRARDELRDLRAELDALRRKPPRGEVSASDIARQEDATEAAARRRRAMDRISAMTSVLPVLDARPDDEILGYDDMAA